MNLKKLKTILLLSAITLAVLPAEGLFSDYDFTFYKTVFESLNISDGTSIGFDYTGFGFLGNKNTNGLIVRLGVQAPYTTLANIFADENTPALPEENPDSPTLPDADRSEVLSFSTLAAATPQLPDVQTKAEEEIEKNEFTFTAMIGPAARYVITPQLDAYAGVGIKLEEHIIFEVASSGDYRKTSYDTRINADFDMGFKFNLETHTSVRFGLYGTYDMISYLYTSELDASREEQRTASASNLHINLIAFGEFRNKLSATGYISMGKTFSSQLKEKVYRYEITEREIGKGQLIELGSDTAPIGEKIESSINI